MSSTEIVPIFTEVEVVDVIESVQSAKPLKKYRKSHTALLEKAEYRAMYLFYESLGENRSLKKVAAEFSKSIQWINQLSQQFGWQARLQEAAKTLSDPVVAATKSQVDDVRMKLVAVVHDVTDTLFELSQLSTKARAENLSELNDRDKVKLAGLQTAMTVYGFELDKPKSLRDLLAILKEVTRFNDNKPEFPAPPRSLTQINAPGAKLIIHDD